MSSVYRTPATGSLISTITGESVPSDALGTTLIGRSVRIRPSESRHVLVVPIDRVMWVPSANVCTCSSVCSPE
jgi:hypothetical protein